MKADRDGYNIETAVVLDSAEYDRLRREGYYLAQYEGNGFGTMARQAPGREARRQRERLNR